MNMNIVIYSFVFLLLKAVIGIVRFYFKLYLFINTFFYPFTAVDFDLTRYQKEMQCIDTQINLGNVKYFFTNRKNEIDCILILLSFCVHGNGSGFTTDPYNEKFSVKKVNNKTMIEEKISDRQNITTNYGTVKNEHTSLQQEGSIASHSITETNTHQVSIGAAVKLSAKAGISIPLVGNTDITVEFTGSYTATNSKSIATIVTAPAQKVFLKPRTQATIAYTFFKYERVSEYLIDFEIDETASEIFGESLVKFQNGACFGNLYNNNNKPGLVFVNDKFVLKNFPATEKFWGYGVDINIGKEQPIY